jgi:hypothetical protein
MTYKPSVEKNKPGPSAASEAIKRQINRQSKDESRPGEPLKLDSYDATLERSKLWCDDGKINTNIR